MLGGHGSLGFIWRHLPWEHISNVLGVTQSPQGPSPRQAILLAAAWEARALRTTRALHWVLIPYPHAVQSVCTPALCLCSAGVWETAEGRKLPALLRLPFIKGIYQLILYFAYEVVSAQGRDCLPLFLLAVTS